jgi:hypothetical protein
MISLGVFFFCQCQQRPSRGPRLCPVSKYLDMSDNVSLTYRQSSKYVLESLYEKGQLMDISGHLWTYMKSAAKHLVCLDNSVDKCHGHVQGHVREDMSKKNVPKSFLISFRR